MKRFRLALASLMLIVLAVPGLASADVNDFTITSFDSDQTLTRSDKQGELRIIEKIDVTFTDNNHGILRALPDRYKGHSLQLKVNQVSSESGAPSEYTTYKQNGNTVLKIGSPSRTVTGVQSYTIDYTMRNVVSFYNDHAELYWDVNGNDWRQPFNKVSVRLHLPAEVRLREQPTCYTGSFGSTERECAITQSGSTIVATTNAVMYAGENLTYVAAFEPGYFSPATPLETISEYSRQIIGFTLPFLALGGTSVITWWRRGRDAKGRGTIVPQYEAPDKLSPLAVETIMNFTATNRAITATIINLAIRGYIKIIETKKSKLLGKDQLEYSLELLKADYAQLDANETKLMQALFSRGTVGEINELPKSKSKLYTTAGALKNTVKKELTKAGYFKTYRPGGLLRGLLTILGIAIGTIAGTVLFGGFFIAGLVAGGVVGVVCWIAMDARTAQGVEAKEHIEGLKLYLNTAEKDRLNKLQAPNAAYVATPEPKKTVELFEKLLPFAIVLGVEKGWAKQFESLYTTPPDWYSGNWSTFHAGYLVSSINSGVGSAVSSSFSPPASSSSSGSGGGGSSGGGGGGGGGGGW